MRVVLALLLSMSAALWGLSSALCPLNCSCPLVTTTSCAGLGMLTIPKNIDPNVERLDLSMNNIEILHIEEELLSLEFLNLSYNYIHQAHFNKYYPSLKHLDLSYNRFSNLHSLKIKDLKNLTILDISGNSEISQLKSLQSENLQVLDLSSCNISSYESGFIKNLHSLKDLNLNDNSLVNLNGLLVSNSLHSLKLARNKIKSISLINFPELKILDVSGNIDLEFLVPSSCHPLKVVDFSRGSSHRINIENLCNIESINLAQNNIMAVDSTAFTHNSKIKYLNMSSSNLVNIDERAFSNTKQIKILDVSNNQLKELEWLNYLIELQILNASQNKIESISGVNLDSVTRLDFSHNEINMFEISLRESFPKIEHLNLHSNKVENLPPMSSDTLKTLRLSYCQISIIVPNTFQDLKHLNLLDLSGNKLKRLSYESLLAVPSLLDVTLGHNPWTCDCKSQQFQNLFNYLVNKTLGEKPDTLRCDAVGKTWLEVCPISSPNNLSDNHHVLFVVGVFFLVALLGMGALIYCKSKQIRSRIMGDHISTEPLQQSNSTLPTRPSMYYTPVRRARSEADMVRSAPLQLSLPPPTYEEALMLPPLTEVERMTRSMGVLVDRGQAVS